MPNRLLGALYRHYLLIVPPVLVAEIGADLTKKRDGGPDHWPPRNSGSFTFQRWNATMAMPARKPKAVRCPTPPPGYSRELIDTFGEAMNQKRRQSKI